MNEGIGATDLDATVNAVESSPIEPPPRMLRADQPSQS